MVGGQSGEGIDSTGDIFATALHRYGYWVFGFRHFPSRIRGGHTNYRVRVSRTQVHTPGERIDIMAAFDQDSLKEFGSLLSPGAAVIFDPGSVDIKLPAGAAIRECPVPLTDIAEKAGGAIMKNVVSIGAAAGLMGLEPAVFDSVIAEVFGKKGEQIVAANRRAVRDGFAYAQEHCGVTHRLAEPAEPPGMIISGNEAVALGALAAGCRFLSAYPITPATSIMYWLVDHFPDYGGVVIQAEDEIAAINMAIGAGFAGARAMTSTSGPGFSLMMEALGLAGITETPLVIVDVQRGGPSTGLPTKTEQGDLNEILDGTHGEIPRIVLAPRTAAEAYELARRAFDLAEIYQCPVIIASDLFLGLGRASVPVLPPPPFEPDRGKLVTAADLQAAAGERFPRYRLTADGISPRSIPGQPSGEFVATGNEHNEFGPEIEDPGLRVAMMQKRLRKLQGFDLGDESVWYGGADDPDVLLVGWGSTWGALEEARTVLAADQRHVGHLHIVTVMPLPVERLRSHIQAAREIVICESNATGQMEAHLRRHGLLPDEVRRVHRYDGNPLTAADVLALWDIQPEPRAVGRTDRDLAAMVVPPRGAPEAVPAAAPATGWPVIDPGLLPETQAQEGGDAIDQRR